MPIIGLPPGAPTVVRWDSSETEVTPQPESGQRFRRTRPLARQLVAASSQYVSFTGGGLSNAPFTHGTVAVLVRRDNLTAGTLLAIHASGSQRYGISIGAGNQFELWVTGLAASAQPTASANNQSDWLLCVITKASGSVAPRFHICNLSTGTWLHEDGPAIADGTNNITDIDIGRWSDATDYSTARIAMAAAYRGWVPTDAQVEAQGFNTASQNWLNAASNADASGVWNLNLAPASTLTDLTGGGGTETTTNQGAQVIGPVFFHSMLSQATRPTTARGAGGGSNCGSAMMVASTTARGVAGGAPTAVASKLATVTGQDSPGGGAVRVTSTKVGITSGSSSGSGTVNHAAAKVAPTTARAVGAADTRANHLVPIPASGFGFAGGSGRTSGTKTSMVTARDGAGSTSRASHVRSVAVEARGLGGSTGRTSVAPQGTIPTSGKSAGGGTCRASAVRVASSTGRSLGGGCARFPGTKVTSTSCHAVGSGSSSGVSARVASSQCRSTGGSWSASTQAKIARPSLASTGGGVLRAVQLYLVSSVARLLGGGSGRTVVSQLAADVAGGRIDGGGGGRGAEGDGRSTSVVDVVGSAAGPVGGN